jgi:hypothetical protein
MSSRKEELERQENQKVAIDPEDNRKIWERGAQKPPAKIEVEVETVGDGLLAVLPGTEIEEPEPEPEPEVEEESEESEETEEQDEEETEEPEEEDSEETDKPEEDEEEDYEEILAGTVGEAKDGIDELNNPDYEKLLELEKEGKDRKTLKQFLESKL